MTLSSDQKENGFTGNCVFNVVTAVSDANEIIYRVWKTVSAKVYKKPTRYFNERTGRFDMLTCYANAITSCPISSLSCSTSCGTSSDTTVLLRGTKPACDSFPVLDDGGGFFSRFQVLHRLLIRRPLNINRLRIFTLQMYCKQYCILVWQITCTCYFCCCLGVTVPINVYVKQSEETVCVHTECYSVVSQVGGRVQGGWGWGKEAPGAPESVLVLILCF